MEQSKVCINRIILRLQQLPADSEVFIKVLNQREPIRSSKIKIVTESNIFVTFQQVDLNIIFGPKKQIKLSVSCLHSKMQNQLGFAILKANRKYIFKRQEIELAVMKQGVKNGTMYLFINRAYYQQLYQRYFLISKIEIHIFKRFIDGNKYEINFRSSNSVQSQVKKRITLKQQRSAFQNVSLSDYFYFGLRKSKQNGCIIGWNCLLIDNLQKGKNSSLNLKIHNKKGQSIGQLNIDYQINNLQLQNASQCIQTIKKLQYLKQLDFKQKLFRIFSDTKQKTSIGNNLRDVCKRSISVIYQDRESLLKDIQDKKLKKQQQYFQMSQDNFQNRHTGFKRNYLPFKLNCYKQTDCLQQKKIQNWLFSQRVNYDEDQVKSVDSNEFEQYKNIDFHEPTASDRFFKVSGYQIVQIGCKKQHHSAPKVVSQAFFAQNKNKNILRSSIQQRRSISQQKQREYCQKISPLEGSNFLLRFMNIIGSIIPYLGQMVN